MTQKPKLEASRRVPRILVSLPDEGTPRRNSTTRVVVAWHTVSAGGTAALEPTQVELEADLEAPASMTWITREPSASGWVEALSSARCSEVVLTARSDDPPSKHLVFELAGLLAQELAATQPLIRVRFLPPATTQRRARSAA